jgi:hypothetical protein
VKRCNQPHRKEARRLAAQAREEARTKDWNGLEPCVDARDYYADKMARRGLAPEIAASMPNRKNRRTS